MLTDYANADVELKRAKDVDNGVENFLMHAMKSKIGSLANPAKEVQIFVYAPTFNAPAEIIRTTPARWIVASVFLVLVACWFMFERR